LWLVYHFSTHISCPLLGNLNRTSKLVHVNEFCMVLGAPFRVTFSAFKVTILTPNVSPETEAFWSSSELMFCSLPFRYPRAERPFRIGLCRLLKADSSKIVLLFGDVIIHSEQKGAQARAPVATRERLSPSNVPPLTGYAKGGIVYTFSILAIFVCKAYVSRFCFCHRASRTAQITRFLSCNIAHHA
jgi:hypothetical protein